MEPWRTEILLWKRERPIILTYWEMSLCSHRRTVTHRNISERCSVLPRTAVFIHPPFPGTIPALHSLRFPADKWKEETNRREILGEILSGCLLEAGREYLTSCIIRLDVPSFREIYDRAGLRRTRVVRVQHSTSFKILSSLRYFSPLSFEISSSSGAHMRRTRRHVSFGDAATWGDVPAECRRSRAWSFRRNTVIRLRGSRNTGATYLRSHVPLGWLLG